LRERKVLLFLDWRIAILSLQNSWPGRLLVTKSNQITGQPSRRETPITASPPPVSRPGGALQRCPFWTAVLATAALGLGTLAFFNPCYETNDDVMMNLIAAGRAVVDRPEEHLLFINVVLGWPLSRLYMLAPAVPWYGISQLAALLAAAAGTAYALLRINPSLRRLVVVALFLVLAVLPCLTQMQYTKTATLVSLAGLLLFLAPLRGATPWPRVADVGAGALLLLGSLIRFQSFLLASVIAFPLAAVAVATTPRAALRRAVPVGVTLALVFVLYFANRAYYFSDPDWQEFYPYYAIRSQFTDYQRFVYSAETRPAFEAVGWEEVDWEMLMNWCYADRERYSLDKLRQIVETAAPAPRPPLGESVLAMWRSVVESPVLRQLVLASFCVAVLTGSGWRRFWLPCVMLGLAFGLTVALRSYYWNPPRVLVSLFAGALACTGLRPDSLDPARPRPAVGRSALFARAAAGLCAAYLVLRALTGLAEDDGYRQEVHVEATRSIRRLKLRPDQLFVVWREQFPFEHLVVPLKDPAILRPFRCLSLSGMLETPFTERRLRDFKIDDVYRAIWERPDVLLVTDPKLLDFFERYVRVHYQKDLDFRILVDHPGEPAFMIVQAKPKTTAR